LTSALSAAGLRLIVMQHGVQGGAVEIENDGNPGFPG